MVEKKKILKQLVFLVCILIASSSIVNARTVLECPSNTKVVPGTSKCCAKFYGVSAVKAEANQCYYTKKNLDPYFKRGKTYDGVTCPLIGSYCTGKYPFDATSKTYTTTVYFQESWGGEYITKECTQAQCQWTISYSNCPSGTYFAGWQKVSGKVDVYGNNIYTTSDTISNYSGSVKALCYYNKPPVTTTGTETEEELKQIEEPVEEVCPASGK